MAREKGVVVKSFREGVVGEALSRACDVGEGLRNESEKHGIV